MLKGSQPQRYIISDEMLTYLEVMFEFESLSTVGTFESSKDGGFIMRDHMPLQSVDVGEVLLAHLAPLRKSD